MYDEYCEYKLMLGVIKREWKKGWDYILVFCDLNLLFVSSKYGRCFIMICVILYYVNVIDYYVCILFMWK